MPLQQDYTAAVMAFNTALDDAVQGDFIDPAVAERLAELATAAFTAATEAVAKSSALLDEYIADRERLVEECKRMVLAAVRRGGGFGNKPPKRKPPRHPH